MELETRPGAPEMEELLYQLLWSQLQSLGLFREKQVILTNLREQAGISASYDRWLKESLELLERQQYLQFNRVSSTRLHETYNILGPTQSESTILWQRWDEHKERWRQNADLKAQVVLVETMLCALPAILTGERSATEIMFPNGSMQLVEGIYQHNVTADYFNEVLATLVATYLQNMLARDRDTHIRILEIGAGTGGTTSRVLQMVQPYQASIAEYCYSDISEAFLRYGQRRYAAEHPYLTYQLFNVEKALAGQGIESGSYDLVIAANVLHATCNIRHTVRNAKAALKKHGWFLLNEITGASLFTHLTFGLLEGWWAYEDPELRVPGCPALIAESWEAVLSREGFGAFYMPTRDMQEIGQQVIVAESDGIVRQQHTQSAIRADSQESVNRMHTGWSDTNTRVPRSDIQAQSVALPQTTLPHKNGESNLRVYSTDQMVKDHVHSILLESIVEVLNIDVKNIQDDTSFSK